MRSACLHTQAFRVVWWRIELVRKTALKTAHILLCCVASLGTQLPAQAQSEYFHSPAKKILCSIRAPLADGSREASGTDLNDPRKVIMETLRFDTQGVRHQSWEIPRDTHVAAEGGYGVFRKHCSPLMQILPTDVRDLLHAYFEK